ncbi:MAG: hypothetical protein KBS85_07425 [Lachnospiraceae bacterium]|nr:hypothetical protein [Candidatus Merdinaster equi]
MRECLTKEKRESGKIKYIFAIGGIVIMFGLVMLATYLVCKYNETSPLFAEKTIELGDAASFSDDIYDYLEGHEDVLEKANIDCANVDVNAVGEYMVSCDTWLQHFEYSINVVDTTAPELALKEMPCLRVNEAYSIDEFIESVFDLSENVCVRFDAGLKNEAAVSIIQGDAYNYGGDTSASGSDYEAFMALECGEYDIALSAVDASGNETVMVNRVKFDEPPVFMFVDDKYVKRGSDYKLMDYVVAYDNESGFITDKVVINDGGFDIETVGNYSVTYSVTDINNLTTSKTVFVTVGDENSNMGIWYTREDIAFLDEHNYFTYEPLSEGNLDEAIKLTTPTEVDLASPKGFASAYIYDITPDYIIMLTAKHCTKLLQNLDIMFYDDVTSYGLNPDYISCKKADLAMFVIPTNAVPVTTLLNLREVYIDDEVVNETRKGDTVFACTLNWKAGEKDIFTPMEVYAVDVPEYDGSINVGYMMLVTERGTVGGQSGSGVFDLKGRLIGTVEGARRRVNGSDIGKWFGVQDSITNLTELFDRRMELVADESVHA